MFLRLITGASILFLLFSCSAPFREKEPAPEEIPTPKVEVTPIERGETLVIEGVKYYEDGKADSAIEAWKSALEYLPEDGEIHNWLGVAYLKKNQMDSAIYYYKKSIELNKENYQAYNNLGYVYFKKGDYEKALKYFEKALAINPFFEQAQLNYETTKKILEGKRSLEAFELFEKAANEDSLEVQLGYYKKVISLDSNYVDAFNNIGVAYYYLGQIDSSIIYLKKALDLNPKYPEANNNLGFILSQLGLNKKAIPFFLKAIQERPNYIIALINLADSYYYLKDYNNAQKVLDEALKLDPENMDIKRRIRRIKYMMSQQ
jgi:superkiller protein 3